MTMAAPRPPTQVLSRDARHQRAKGKHMPRIFGLDVSHHQGTLSWPSIASGGVEFCFIKATEGTSFVDDKFERNWRGAQDAGLFRGAYHFGRVGSDPATQAVHFR